MAKGKSKKPNKQTEAEIHFDLYRRLMNLIEPGLEIGGVNFHEVKPEFKVNGGFVDLAVFDNSGKAWCVIEAKRYDGAKIARHIDPNSPAVVKQAAGYAILLGAPYFVTYNGFQGTLFKTQEKFVPLIQRKGKPYDVKTIGKDKFARLILEDLVALDQKAISWAPLDERFIARLRSLHHYVFVPLVESLHKKLESSTKFKGIYQKWVEGQGYNFDDPVTHEYIAAEGAYLLINKILFYKILERKYGKDLLAPLLPVQDVTTFAKSLRERLDEALKIDYRAIFNRDRIFDEIPITTSVAHSLNEFLREMEEYSLEALSSDVIGRVYENLIPPEERHDLGQYYTPPPICELIVKHVVQSSKDLVMVSACGSGGFLVQIYDRLAKLAGKAAKHSVILQQIWGIDINRFPAHLAAINMTLKDIGAESDDIRIFVGDFFDVEPKGQIELPWLADPKAAITQAHLDEAEGKELGEYFPGSFDAAVANPPYIRQEQIADKNKARRHLKKREKDFSSRSDIYVYFFTHVSEFLKQDGRLGFIVSNRWLFTDYGEDLQRFFLKNYLIEAVILLERQQFAVPLIGTCVVLIRKRADSFRTPGMANLALKFDMEAEAARSQNLVKFIRVHGDISVDELLKVVEKDTFKAETLVEGSDYSVYSIAQAQLVGETKWMKYFAPKVVHDLLNCTQFVELQEVFDTEFGIKTGANDFFYMTLAEADQRGIKAKYLRPLIKSVGQADYIEFRAEDTEWYVLDLHEHIKNIIKEEALDALKGKKLERAIIEGFRGVGAEGLAEYLEDGERRKINEIPSIVGRLIWFDLGLPTVPLLIFTKEYWKKAFCCSNPDGLALDQHLYPLVSRIKAKPDVLGGVMNCVLIPLLREIFGREASGEALNRNEFTVAEAKKLPIVDPRKISAADQKRIAQAFSNLIKRERDADGNELAELRKRLDCAVLRSISMQDRFDEVQAAVTEYLKRRTAAGGIQKRVLVY